MSNMMDDLDKEVENAEAWLPVEGDKLVGRVTRVDQRETEYGIYPILTLEVEAGTQEGKAIELPATLSWHVLTTVAKGELGWDVEANRWGEDRKVFVGCKVGTKYVEDRQGKNSKYAFWRVIVEPAPTMAEQLDAGDDGMFSS
jgi:hypothetical protein